MSTGRLDPRHATHTVVRALLVALLLFAAFLLPLSAAAMPAEQVELDLTARAAIVVEYPSGKILYTKDADKRLAMASTTKIMTAILALQRGNLDDVITVQEEALVGEASMYLVEGEEIRLEDVLYGLMLPSGNDAAMTLAIHIGSQLSEPADEGPVGRFVALMNKQAQAMGLTNTHYDNPHGLDSETHYSSAADLASIAWYALHDPEFNKIVSTVYTEVPGHSLENLNRMLTRYEGADGVKTGQTDEAGLCLVSSATRDGRRMIAVVLNANRWYDDSTKLLDYGFSTDPNGQGGTLNIAKRAGFLWLLASGLPAPLPTARPTLIPPTHAAGVVDLAAAPTQPATEPATSGGPVLSSGSVASVPIEAPVAGDANGSGWLVPLVALLLGGTVLVVYWRRFAVRPAPVGGATWEEKKQRLRSSGARTPGSAASARTRSQVTRVEPKRISLLDDDNAAAHARRGIALAFRGQEGSSLAEFMLAVRRDPEFEFGTLDGFYDMPAAGFLSLARAYAENNRKHYARALLQLGAETYPDDKPIQKMLVELQPQQEEAAVAS